MPGPDPHAPRLPRTSDVARRQRGRGRSDHPTDTSAPRVRAVVTPTRDVAPGERA